MILPSAYFGNIEYYSHLYRQDKVVIDIHEPYPKQTYRSRCEIAGANGKQTLSVPVIRPHGKDSLMHEIQISYTEHWMKDHLKAIESAYARTPYYEFYIDAIQDIFGKRPNTLIQLNHALTNLMIEKIGLTVQLSFSTEQTPLIEDDFRINFSHKKDGTFNTYRYIQPFEEKHGFIPNCSILDLLFNEGPNSISILQESTLL